MKKTCAFPYALDRNGGVISACGDVSAGVCHLGSPDPGGHPSWKINLRRKVILRGCCRADPALDIKIGLYELWAPPSSKAIWPSKPQGYNTCSRLTCLTSPPAPRPYHSTVFALDKGTPIPFHEASLQVFLSTGISSPPSARVSPVHSAARINHQKTQAKRSLLLIPPAATSGPRPFYRPQPWDGCAAS